jgi:hypothetical protein
MTIALLGQTPEVGQIDAFTTEAEKYSQPSIGLRLRLGKRTPVFGARRAGRGAILLGY